jgi:hypothetical protein
MKNRADLIVTREVAKYLVVGIGTTVLVTTGLVMAQERFVFGSLASGIFYFRLYTDQKPGSCTLFFLPSKPSLSPMPRIPMRYRLTANWHRIILAPGISTLRDSVANLVSLCEQNGRDDSNIDEYVERRWQSKQLIADKEIAIGSTTSSKTTETVCTRPQHRS